MSASELLPETPHPETPAVHNLERARALWRDWLPRCANASCARRSFTHAITLRHTGILLADEWLCSPECFEEAARARIAALLSSGHAQEPPPRLRMPIGLALLSRGLLTTEQLKAALDEQAQSGENIGDIVQRFGFATPEQVTAAVAAQWSCPVFLMGDRHLEPQVHVPRRLLELYGMLPVHFSEATRRLMVGFVSRVQYHILYTIEHITSCVAIPCFITSREYQQYLQLPVFSERENEIVFERTSSTAEMAQLARNYIHQAGAHQTRLGICRDYLWVRIWGRRSEIDLLFRLQQD